MPAALPAGFVPEAIDSGDLAGFGPYGGPFVDTPAGWNYIALHQGGTAETLSPDLQLVAGAGATTALWLRGHLLAGVYPGGAFIMDWTQPSSVVYAPGLSSGRCDVEYDDGVFAYASESAGPRGATVALWNAFTGTVRRVVLPHTANRALRLAGLSEGRLLYTTNGTAGATSAIYILDTASGKDTAVRGMDAGTTWSAMGFAGPDEILVHGGADGSADWDDLLVSAGDPDISSPLVEAPAGNLGPVAGPGYVAEYDAASQSTVVYAAGRGPSPISLGMPQRIDGQAGFAVVSGCNSFRMFPTLDAGGLPVAALAEPPFDDLATAPDVAAIGEGAATCVWRGFPDGTFRPQEPFTRAQFAAVLSRFGDLTPPLTRDCHLTDVPRVSWALMDECTAVADGLMGSGGEAGPQDASFGPEQETVTMQAFAVAVARLMRWQPGGAAAGASDASVQALQAHHVWVGALSPDHPLTRAEAAQLFHLLRPYQDGMEPLRPPAGWTA